MSKEIVIHQTHRGLRYQDGVFAKFRHLQRILDNEAAQRFAGVP